MVDTKNNIAIHFLLSPKYRILRHLILFTLISLITIGNIWHIKQEWSALSYAQALLIFLVYDFLFLTGIYINTYLLVPKLLLKNRWLTYFAALLVVVAIVVFFCILLQLIIPSSSHQPMEHWMIMLFLISNLLAVTSLFAGPASLMLLKHWILNDKRSEELESATLHSELKLLESQINPHFLFNMLNNANIMIEEDPDMALHIIMKLKDMLRYQMNENSSETVHLREDILFLTDFLELEKIRRDCFEYTITEKGDIETIQIPPLLFITFVENAVKHNLDSQAASYVHILFEVADNKLIFICENSIPEKPAARKTGGLGLLNIKRRLDLLYDNNYSLDQTQTDIIYTVKLELKL